jgi:DNA replication protein DnaC
MSSDLVAARLRDGLQRLHLGRVDEQLDALLATAARTQPTYLDFLDQVVSEELESKKRKRLSMQTQIAHFPTVKTLDDFDFKFQPTVDSKLVRELATGRFVSQAENVLVFGPPGVGKTHLAIALGRAVIEAGAGVLFTSATELIASLAKAETGDDHGKARRFDRVERDRRVRRSSDGEARSSQRTSAFAVAV